MTHKGIYRRGREGNAKINLRGKRKREKVRERAESEKERTFGLEKLKRAERKLP